MQFRCRRLCACRRPSSTQLPAKGALPSAIWISEALRLKETFVAAAACWRPFQCSCLQQLCRKQLDARGLACARGLCERSWLPEAVSDVAACRRACRMRSGSRRPCACRKPLRLQLPVGSLFPMQLPAGGLVECNFGAGGFAPVGGLCDCSCLLKPSSMQLHAGGLGKSARMSEALCLQEAFPRAAACQRLSIRRLWE